MRIFEIDISSEQNLFMSKQVKYSMNTSIVSYFFSSFIKYEHKYHNFLKFTETI